MIQSPSLRLSTPHYISYISHPSVILRGLRTTHHPETFPHADPHVWGGGGYKKFYAGSGDDKIFMMISWGRTRKLCTQSCRLGKLIIFY